MMYQGEGNSNPLQYSCLENPVDRGAWWAAIYGVAQSWTWLKRLSSSSSMMYQRLCLLTEEIETNPLDTSLMKLMNGKGYINKLSNLMQYQVWKGCRNRKRREILILEVSGVLKRESCRNWRFSWFWREIGSDQTIIRRKESGGRKGAGFLWKQRTQVGTEETMR